MLAPSIVWLSNKGTTAAVAADLPLEPQYLLSKGCALLLHLWFEQRLCELIELEIKLVIGPNEIECALG